MANFPKIRIARPTIRITIYATVGLILSFIVYQTRLPDMYLIPTRRPLSDSEIKDVFNPVETWEDKPIKAPYKDQFSEMSQRTRQIGGWLARANLLSRRSFAREQLMTAAGIGCQILFPFLKKGFDLPWGEQPLERLRDLYVPASQGIVIPVGGDSGYTLSSAGTLIYTIRQVFHSTLPIQVVYSGDVLSYEGRSRIEEQALGESIDFVDIMDVFDNANLGLVEGGWVIKPYAALAAPFEQVAIIEPDTVLVQSPNVLFDQPGYIEKGAYLFHGRLTGQNESPLRHKWWHEQIKEPSPELLKSRMWTEGYSEESDAGVVVINKARDDVLLGLLLVAWQNMYQVRKEVAYGLTNRDKEAWWLALELAGAPYHFEPHYSSQIGSAAPGQQQGGKETNVTDVCSSSAGHTDQQGKLLWLSGGLFKNKNVEPKEYAVPEYWMTDGTWRKSVAEEGMGCMGSGKLMALTDEEKRVLGEYAKKATRVESMFN